jgi:hypothetical protein
MSEVITPAGEIVPIGARLEPAQAAERAAWVREMRKAVLTEGVDYAQLPKTNRPTLLKPGAEMLLLASGLGFTMEKIDDRDARDHEGVTYKASVRRGEQIVAECEGFAGYDESRFYQPAIGTKAEYRAPWNTLVKMAQKRALVGAALNATAASGLFIADVDDERDTQSANKRRQTRGSQVNPPPPRRRDTGGEGQSDDSDPGMANGIAELEQRLSALDLIYRNAFRDWRRSAGLPPLADVTILRDFAAMAAKVGELENEAAIDADTFE